MSCPGRMARFPYIPFFIGSFALYSEKLKSFFPDSKNCALYSNVGPGFPLSSFEIKPLRQTRPETDTTIISVPVDIRSAISRQFLFTGEFNFKSPAL